MLLEMPRVRPRVCRDPLPALQHAQGDRLRWDLLGMQEFVREQVDLDSSGGAAVPTKPRRTRSQMSALAALSAEVSRSQLS